MADQDQDNEDDNVRKPRVKSLHRSDSNFETGEDSPSNNDDTDIQRLQDLAKDGAVGDTMYDKRWVIQNILTVGKHFQNTNYFEDGNVKELDSEIEDIFCTLWDMSVEQDVSVFFLEHGVLDVVTELFLNPNDRVKEISIGLMTNAVVHPKVFKVVIEKDVYLEKVLKLLDESDTPTLLVVFRCLHTYGFNLYNLTKAEEDGAEKEEVKHWASKWLIFVSVETIAQRIGKSIKGAEWVARF